MKARTIRPTLIIAGRVNPATVKFAPGRAEFGSNTRKEDKMNTLNSCATAGLEDAMPSGDIDQSANQVAVIGVVALQIARAVDEIADRLLGAQPVDTALAGTPLTDAVSFGSLGALNGQISRARLSVERINEAVARLNRL